MGSNVVDSILETRSAITEFAPALLTVTPDEGLDSRQQHHALVPRGDFASGAQHPHQLDHSCPQRDGLTLGGVARRALSIEVVFLCVQNGANQLKPRDELQQSTAIPKESS